MIIEWNWSRELIRWTVRSYFNGCEITKHKSPRSGEFFLRCFWKPAAGKNFSHPTPYKKAPLIESQKVLRGAFLSGIPLIISLISKYFGNIGNCLWKRIAVSTRIFRNERFRFDSATSKPYQNKLHVSRSRGRSTHLVACHDFFEPVDRDFPLRGDGPIGMVSCRN